jgi:hypothetical protein
MKQSRPSLAFYMFVLAAVLAAAGLWVATRFQKVEQWPKAVGTVVGIEPVGASKPAKEYTIGFTYEVDGAVFAAETVVSGKGAWQNIKPGSNIDVAYDPNDPESVFVFASGGKMHRGFLYAGAGFAVLAVVLLVIRKGRSSG